MNFGIHQQCLLYLYKHMDMDVSILHMHLFYLLPAKVNNVFSKDKRRHIDPRSPPILSSFYTNSYTHINVWTHGNPLQSIIAKARATQSYIHKYISTKLAHTRTVQNSTDRTADDERKYKKSEKTNNVWRNELQRKAKR